MNLTLNTLHYPVSCLEYFKKLRDIIVVGIDTQEIYLVSLAEFGQFFHPVGVMCGDTIPKIAERRVNPNGLVSFLIQHRDDTEFWQARLPAVTNVYHYKVVLTGERLEIVKIIFIDEVGDHNDHTPPFDGIKCEEDRLAEIGLL